MESSCACYFFNLLPVEQVCEIIIASEVILFVAVGEMHNLDKIKKTMGWGDCVFLPFFSPRASAK
jgi:hypothetical protein